MDNKKERKFVKENHKLANNIYHTVMVLNDFCILHEDIEEITNITPMLEYLKDESDKLNYNFNGFEIETNN